MIILLIKKRNARYLNLKNKFGIKVPQSVLQVYALNIKNGNTLWADAFDEEIRDVRPYFKKLESEYIVPIGYQRVNCHMIFDVKIKDFRRKARLVARGNVTDPPATIMYARVVLRERVRIALTLAARNEVPLKVVAVHNTYITAHVTEKIWTVLVQEFRNDAGRKAIMFWALYGLKSAGSILQDHLADRMHH